MPPHQPQFSTPASHQGTPQNQPPNNNPQSATASTPQTPTFPPTGSAPHANANPNASAPPGASTPISPGTESRERERFSLLLDINQELLYESIQLMNTKAEVKKGQAPPESGADGANGQNGDTLDEEKLIQQDYTQYVHLFFFPFLFSPFFF